MKIKKIYIIVITTFLVLFLCCSCNERYAPLHAPLIVTDISSINPNGCQTGSSYSITINDSFNMHTNINYKVGDTIK